MVKITSTYKGKKNCLSVHAPSGAELITDAPKDNQGLGESFSPTDLVATALGTCIVTTLAIKLEPEGLNLTDVQFSVEKIMTATSPRKIEALHVHLKLRKDTPDKFKKQIEEISNGCPVKLSLAPEVKVPVLIEYSI